MKVGSSTRKYILDLYKKGFTYHEINSRIERERGIVVTDDCVRKIIQSTKPKKKSTLSRCLVISDLHIPFQRKELLDVVEAYANKIDTLILGGDIVDCSEISVFQELGKIPLIDEMEQAYKVLERIQELTPNVRRMVIWGNHELRFEKYLATRAKEVSGLCSSNILNEIVNGFTVYDHQYEDYVQYAPLDYEVVDNWYTQYNDMIVCHPKSFSKIQGRTAVNATEYFIKNGFDFNAVLVAHTHHAAVVPNLNKWGVEIGCMCKPMSYQQKGNLNYTPQQNSFFLAAFEKNKFDFNQSKLIQIDD